MSRLLSVLVAALAAATLGAAQLNSCEVSAQPLQPKESPPANTNPQQDNMRAKAKRRDEVCDYILRMLRIRRPCVQ